jgi:hypothetical protein
MLGFGLGFSFENAHRKMLLLQQDELNQELHLRRSLPPLLDVP